MYLPRLPALIEEELVVLLYRPITIADDLLRDPPRRVAQLLPEARRHLKVKLAAYWSRIDVTHEQLPLHERFEEAVRLPEGSASPYDIGQRWPDEALVKP